MKLKLCFSTCPNDTFIFDAIANKRIDLKGYDFNIYMTDIEELNLLAINSEADITKISINAFTNIASDYQLITSGSALGFGVGPLVISSRKIYPDELEYCRIGIPGLHTTANLLFSMAFPKATNKRVYRFSDIEEALLTGEIDVGVIIHENRFTYQLKGLKKIIDLGEFWENKTQLPLPLGGIAIKRSFPTNIKLDIDQLIRSSIEYAYKYPNDSKAFIKQYAQELNDEIIQQHIDLYVNKYSISIGETGKAAISTLYQQAHSLGLIKSELRGIFVQ